MSRAPVAGSTLVASQRSVRANTVSLAAPIAISLPTQENSVHGATPSMTEIGAKAQRVDRAARGPLELAHGRQVDDVHALLARRRRSCGPARRRSSARRAALLHEGGHELLDELPAGGRRELAAHDALAVAMMVSVWVASSKRVASVARRSSRISIRKWILGRMPRCRRVEAAGRRSRSPRRGRRGASRRPRD